MIRFDIYKQTVQLVIFYLHLILHTCVQRFDVTGTAQTFLASLAN
jgi:hypothetical protein